MRPLPANDLDICREVIARLNGYSQVEVETNRYSVPTGEQLQAVGYKVVPSQRSKVKDIRLFAKLAIENGLITKEQFIEICDIVLDRLVEIAVPRLKESGIATQKAATERINQVLEPAMQKYDIAPRIVRTNEQQKEIQ